MEPSLYDDPVIYDILHTPGTAADADALLRIWALERAGRRRRRMLEPACGSGRLLRVLQRRGCSVAGFDSSAKMVAYARRRMRPRTPLFVADMESFRPELGSRRFDFAFNLINSIRHLPSDRALQRHLREVGRVLDDRGLYAVGLSLTRYGAEEPSEDEWTGTRGRCEVAQLVQYLPPRGRDARGRYEQVLSHLRIRRPRGTEHRTSRYRLRCYDARQWDAQWRRAGFERVGCYDMHGAPVDPDASDYALHVLRQRGP